jgi:anaerobic magnesium-protoporphyrin IX monomethyl ester cyclase
MKVLLINPPPLERVPARIVTPPLGLLYLAASLKAHGIEAVVLDADALDLRPAQVGDVARRARPGVIGVTAMTPTADAAYAAIAEARPYTDCLVLGGAHASALGARVFTDCPTRLDAVICGEAEEVFPEFVRRAADGAESGGAPLPGVLLPGAEAAPSPDIDWPKIAELDALPFPDRAGLPWRRYRHPLLAGGPVTTMITSRGCPYRCIFCAKHVGGTRWRARSAANVLDEMSAIALNHGITRIIIYDDLFTLDRGRVIEICEGIIARGLSLRWKCEGRVNRVDAEVLGWMARAGCEMIAYGVESASPAGLAFLDKGITPDQVREAFALTRAAGIKTLGYYLLGVPGETMADERKTVELAISTRADYAQFGVLSPFPGTRLAELASARGWVHEVRARGPAERGSRRAVIEDGYWTVERLDAMLAYAHCAFYGRPGYVWERLRAVRSAGELSAGVVQAGRLAAWGLRSRLGGVNERGGKESGAMSDSGQKLRVCYFGTYSKGEEYARNNAIMGGLAQNGVEVIPCQVDVFPTHELKMGAVNKGLLGQAWPFLRAYVRLAAKYLALPDHDFMFVGYIGHIDMFPAWILGKLRGKTIVFDAFYSLYDTMILDRGLYPKDSLRARLLWWIDRWSCRLSDLALLDTWEHVNYFRTEFGLDRRDFHAIPLGTDEKNFFPRPFPPEDGILDVISYSSYIPLHGLEIQLEAAGRLREHKDIRFTFVGKGQLYPEIRAQAERMGLDNVTFIEWLSHAELVDKIAAADVCLGIFGRTEKASRVIPYKAYEALAMRKPLITGDSKASRELLVDGVHALLSPMSDPAALAERLLRLRDDPGLRRALATAGHELFAQKGVSRAMAGSILAALAARWPGKVPQDYRAGELELLQG